MSEITVEQQIEWLLALEALQDPVAGRMNRAPFDAILSTLRTHAKLARDKADPAAIARAYGYLWWTNNMPDMPMPSISTDRAAYEARKELRDLLTHKQRGDGISYVGKLLGLSLAEGVAEGGTK